MGCPIQWQQTTRNMDNFFGTTHQQLIEQASCYLDYCELIKNCNAHRREFNNESDRWVKTFNDQKTIDNLVRILLVLPERFVMLRTALRTLHEPVNAYTVSQHWFKMTPFHLLNEMKDLYGWSRKARAAKKKYLLLTNPTPEIARDVRNLDPGFYADYLKHCQCPSLTVHDWEFRLPYLKPVSKDEFVVLQSSLSTRH